jgi:CBS domain containing-hemolysin-like protein
LSESRSRSEDPGSTGPLRGRILAGALKALCALFLVQLLFIHPSRAAEAPAPGFWAELRTRSGPFAALFALFVAHALFAAAETALRSVSRARITGLAEEGHPRAKYVLRLLERPASFLTAIQVVKTLFTMGIAVQGYVLIYLLFAHHPNVQPFIGVLTVFVSIFLLLLFGEIIPKVIASQHSDRVALFSGWWIGLFTAVIYPLFRGIDRLSQVFVTRAAGKAGSRSPMEAEEEIKMMAAGGVETGEIEPEEQEMIRGVLTATDMVVREVMVPRIDITAVEISRPMEELLSAILEEGHSRIPIYEETIDRIIGIVHARDLIRATRTGTLDQMAIRELPLREPHFIPENKRLLDLLEEFRESSLPIAVVVDEYGGTSGLVTIEDLVEEIVGEIKDESDVEEEPFQRVDEKTVIFASRVPVEDVNEEMKCHLPEDEFDTIGGFVFGQMGRVPSPGQSVQYDGLVLTVEAADRHRIQRIRVTRSEEQKETAEEEPAGKNA